jgi:hypothetical protein
VPQAPRRSLPGVLLMLRLAAALACYLLMMYAWFGPSEGHPFFSMVGYALAVWWLGRKLYELVERWQHPGVPILPEAGPRWADRPDPGTVGEHVVKPPSVTTPLPTYQPAPAGGENGGCRPERRSTTWPSTS